VHIDELAFLIIDPSLEGSFVPTVPTIPHDVVFGRHPKQAEQPLRYVPRTMHLEVTMMIQQKRTRIAFVTPIISKIVVGKPFHLPLGLSHTIHYQSY
jgi:hypothetical protein